jgi:hypothetical protein
MASAEPPLLLLDVDGVVNALGDELDPAVWSDWRTGWAEADGRRWQIRWSPSVVQRLRDWHDTGAVELQWLTTWGHDANGELRALLELPELAVAGTYDEDPDALGSPDAGVDGRSHAAVAPAAPDPLSGHWWKYDVVQRVRRRHPGRLVLWVDDELHRPDLSFRRWAEAQADVVAVGPDPACGLSPRDLDRVAGLLTEAERRS